MTNTNKDYRKELNEEEMKQVSGGAFTYNDNYAVDPYFEQYCYYHDENTNMVFYLKDVVSYTGKTNTYNCVADLYSFNPFELMIENWSGELVLDSRFMKKIEK